MAKFRQALPQNNGTFFLTDAGLETDLIFNHGVEIREFAAHTLLSDSSGRSALVNYFREFLQLARDTDAGYILDCVTWKAHRHWASDLGATPQELREANEEAVGFVADLRDEFSANGRPIVLNAVIGPKGDAYTPEGTIGAEEAENYHAEQMRWLAATEVDMVTALTHTQSSEAIGIVKAAQGSGLPIVVSFTVETDGRLPTGESIGEAIAAVDLATNEGPSYYMINCAHPDHFAHVLDDEPWLRRIKGIRCNASRKSHAELDECEHLDAGNPEELGNLYRLIMQRMPWINVVGGCCGSDVRHIKAIADAVGNPPLVQLRA